MDSLFWLKTKKKLRILFNLFSGFLIFVIFFSFTSGPFWMFHWLGTSVSEYKFKPDYIIMLSGSGHPSESSLLRSYYISKLHVFYPEATIIVSQLAEDSLKLEKTDAWLIRSELILRGVDSTKIEIERTAKNTRDEAIQMFSRFPDSDKNWLIVTSPEHMRRSVLSFRKVGFKNVGGSATFSSAGPSNLKYKSKKLGGRKIIGDEMVNDMQFRYQFWNHLKYQILCYREFLALIWYKLKGWI